MLLSKEKMWRSAERMLKRTKRYQEKREFGDKENYEIMYVLAKGSRNHTDDVIAFAGVGDEMVISFHPFKSDEVIDNWDFNADGDLFKYLESGYELTGMSMEAHYEVWSCIEDWHDGAIDNTKGMQKYLGYCKRNGITAEKMKTELNYPGMDVMTLYTPKANRTKEYER